MAGKIKDIKSRISATHARNILSGTEENKRFFLSNGTVINDYYGLYKAFKEMDNDTFANHVSSKNNDFSNWIKGVFKDHILARELKQFKTRHAAAVAVSQHIKALNKISSAQEATPIEPVQKLKKTENIKKVRTPKKITEKTTPASEQISVPPFENIKTSNPELITKKAPEVDIGNLTPPQAPSPITNHKVPDHLFSVGGTMFALGILATIVVAINMFKETTTTGAVIGTSAASPSWITWLLLIVVVLTIAGIDMNMRKKAIAEQKINDEEETQEPEAPSEQGEEPVLKTSSESELDNLVTKYHE